jgi:uncharacterized protein (DUF433 family)
MLGSNELVMSTAFSPEPVPLLKDAAGVLRVAGSRVTVDVLVSAFDAGQTAEEIVQQYPSLDLAVVYAVLAYILKHRAEIDAYLEQRARQSGEVRRENQQRFPEQGIRERLLRRRAPA